MNKEQSIQKWIQSESFAKLERIKHGDAKRLGLIGEERYLAGQVALEIHNFFDPNLFWNFRHSWRYANGQSKEDCLGMCYATFQNLVKLGQNHVSFCLWGASVRSPNDATINSILLFYFKCLRMKSLLTERAA